MASPTSAIENFAQIEAPLEAVDNVKSVPMGVTIATGSPDRAHRANGDA
jgi:hypothetical protein